MLKQKIRQVKQRDYTKVCSWKGTLVDQKNMTAQASDMPLLLLDVQSPRGMTKNYQS